MPTPPFSVYVPRENRVEIQIPGKAELDDVLSVLKKHGVPCRTHGDIIVADSDWHTVLLALSMSEIYGSEVILPPV